MRVLPTDRGLRLIVACDGASRGNPGPAGIGVRIADTTGEVLAEIAGLKDRRSRAEDQLIEQMERREELDGRAAKADEEVAVARAHVDALGGDAARDLEQVEAGLVETKAAREALAPEIDEQLLELYEDLRRQKKGIGAAAIVDGVCQACQQKLSAVELDKLKHTEDIKRCEYCRRIVVFA